MGTGAHTLFSASWPVPALIGENMTKKNSKVKIKMLDPMKTNRLEELSLIDRVLDGEPEAIMIFNDLGFRHVVDVTQDYASFDVNKVLKVLRRGLVGYHKALKIYLSEERYKKHKFTTYSTYFIRKEVSTLV